MLIKKLFTIILSAMFTACCLVVIVIKGLKSEWYNDYHLNSINSEYLQFRDYGGKFVDGYRDCLNYDRLRNKCCEGKNIIELRKKYPGLKSYKEYPVGTWKYDIIFHRKNKLDGDSNYDILFFEDDGINHGWYFEYFKGEAKIYIMKG